MRCNSSISRTVAVATLLLVACVGNTASAMQSSGHKSALGTSAAVNPQGQLWIAYAEGDPSAATVQVAPANDVARKIAVNLKPEPVSSDGENRPKLFFGDRGYVYVTWTSPTSANYTGDIRFARSADGGKTWSKPIVVHHDRQLITHRFESMIVDRDGTLWVTWVDKRDLPIATAAKRDYAGAALYYAYSSDHGATWQGDFKLADHTCECCRISLALDATGRVAALWRHVFDGSERDHAFAYLSRQGKPSITRATFDRWKVDACPHHGPGLAIAADGTRHAVWFNQIDGAGRAFYGHLTSAQPQHVRALPEGASHADVAVLGKSVVVVWKRFDGEATRIESWISHDDGIEFASGDSLQTTAESDQPRLVTTKDDVMLVWRRADGLDVRPMLRKTVSKADSAPSTRTANASNASVRAFDRNTLAQIELAQRGRPFWLVLWDLECTYCMKSLSTIARVQQQNPNLDIVTVSTDSLDQAPALQRRLAELGVKSTAYAFGSGTSEALRYAIDPSWMGEKPRAYKYDGNGKRVARTGVLDASEL